MNDHILNAIDDEVERLRQARDILQNVSPGTSRKTAGRSSAATAPEPKARRQLSAKARHAIAEGQRKRWAKVKSQKRPSIAAAATGQETATG